MTKIRIKKSGGYTYVYEGKNKMAFKDKKGRKTGATRYFKYLDMDDRTFRRMIIEDRKLRNKLKEMI